MQYAGKDATEAYESMHPPNLLSEYLALDKHLGELDAILVSNNQEKPKSKDQLRVEAAYKRRPPLGRILNLNDLEVRTSGLTCSHSTYRVCNTDVPQSGGVRAQDVQFLCHVSSSFLT